MTGRLLGRCTRLLSRAHAHAAATAATPRLPAGPLAAGPAAAELLRPPASLWPPRAPGRPLCERASAAASQGEEEFPLFPKRTRLDDLVEKATAVEDILQAWTDLGGDANHAAIAMTKLARVQAAKGHYGPGTHDPDLLADPRLREMMATVTGQVVSVWNGALVNVLRALRTLGVPFTASVLSSVQTEVLWRIRRLSTKNLAFLVEWGAGQKGQHEEVLMTAVFKQLELRWIEILDVKTVSSLMSKGKHMSPTLMDRLEDKALELAESFSAEEIRKVCVSLASQSRRSVPLLRALSYHLLQKPSSELVTSLLLDMAYAYGRLNFHHSQVFQRISSELLPRVPAMSSADITRCAKSFGYLKWLHYPLFEAFTEHYTDNSGRYNTSQLCNLLMTLARLGFQPTKAAEFYKEVHRALDVSLSGLEPFLKTDVVWSMCVLQQAKTSHFTMLTQHKHIAKVTGGSPSRVENYRLKLLHIAATLRLEHPPESWASSTPPLSLPLPSALAPGTTLSPLQSSLRMTLHNLVGEQSEALRTAVDTVYGWTIDGELVVDYENKAYYCSLSSLTAPHLAQGGGGGEPLPAGARRLAFLAWEFPNFGSRSKELLGRFVMKRRHLQLAGFIIVEVPYYEWMELKSDWQRVAYLKDKMGKAVAEDMAK